MDQDNLEVVPEGEFEAESFQVVRKIEKLKEELRQCQKERDDFLAGWQRAKSDYINFKKDAELTNVLVGESSAAGVWRKILEIVDSLERAQKNLPSGLAGNEWVTGVLNIYEGFRKVLSAESVRELSLVGEVFDPQTAEAVRTIEDLSKEEGQIAEVLMKGYVYEKNNKKILLRPAKVVVVENNKNK